MVQFAGKVREGIDKEIHQVLNNILSNYSLIHRLETVEGEDNELIFDYLVWGLMHYCISIPKMEGSGGWSKAYVGYCKRSCSALPELLPNEKPLVQSVDYFNKEVNRINNKGYQGTFEKCGAWTIFSLQKLTPKADDIAAFVRDIMPPISHKQMQDTI